MRLDRVNLARIARLRFPRRRSAGRLETLLCGFIAQLQGWGYALLPLAQAGPVLARGQAFLRYDVLPTGIDLEVGFRLAALHQKLRVPGTFHIAWDMMAREPRLREAVLRLAGFDPDYVHLGLHCDPISEWLASVRFGGDQAALQRFAASPEFASYLDDMLAAWRAEGDNAAALRSLRDGAWASLVALDRSFRCVAGRCASLSGRGSSLSAAFAAARAARPQLEAISAWFQPLDFLAAAALDELGYAFEATRFAPDLGPGPTVLFGGAEVSLLRRSLEARAAGSGGFVAIFPVRYWGGDRYAGLLSELGPDLPAAARSADRALAPDAAADPAAPLPDQPFLTNFNDLIVFGPRCERVDKHQLAAAARGRIGSGADRSFPRFIDRLRGEGYAFGGFEDGPPRFDERIAYLRHDVHIQDLLAAYVLADLHERLGVVGSFQIMWRFSRYEETVEPYFVKLMEFDRRFVQFGLHAAPTATWYLADKLGGDYTRSREAVEGDEFVDWLLELHAAHCRDGDAAPALHELRTGTDDALASIAASFRATFGDWKSISGHGNFLTNGFLRAVELHPRLKSLRTYFAPVLYLAKFGVARFGFDFELTALGRDQMPFPRLISESSATEIRRRWLSGRMASGAGFVALLHPATWTCSHNATFFLPAENAADARTGPSGPAG